MPRGPVDESLLDYLDDFRNFLTVRDRSEGERRPRRPRTLEAYEDHVRALVKWLEEEGRPTTVIKLRPADLDSYFGWLAENRAASTRRLAHIAIDLFLRSLWRDKIISKEPKAMLRVARPQVPKRDPMSVPVMTHAEQLALLDAVRGNTYQKIRDAAMIRLFLDSGVRVSEMLALTVEDVDLDNLEIQVRDGKGGRPRHPVFTAKTGRALRRYLRAREQRGFPAGGGPLWIGQRGPLRGRDAVGRLLARWAADAGLKGVRAHVLRHTWADEGSTNGMSDGDLMELGGWESPAMLQVYGRSRRRERAKESYRRNGIGRHR